MSNVPQRVTDSLAYHGEGPVWWAATGQLRFVDMLAGQVIAVNPDGSHARLDTGADVVACLRPRAGGGAIIARTRDVVVCSCENLSDITALTGEFVSHKFRFNEGNCDPNGRFYIGTLAWHKDPGSAALYCIDPADPQPRQVLDGLTTSNGLGFSPDASLAYFNDTQSLETSIFDYSSQDGLTNRRPLVRYGPDEGRPDGLCVDAEGGVWVAMNKAGHIRRYGADGVLEQRYDLPVRQVTAVAFGGENLDTLFITTSRENLPADEQPAAGSLFAIQPGVLGQMPLTYAG